MKSGPPPVPTAILLARGSWRGKRRPNEPTPKKARPRRPKWLAGEARKKWSEVIKILDEMGVLTVADGDVVGRYCEMHSWWVQLRAFVAQYGEGYPVKNPKGEVISYRQFPQAVLCVKVLVRVDALAAELGLSPASRARLEVSAQPVDADDPRNSFFRAG